MKPIIQNTADKIPAVRPCVQRTIDREAARRREEERETKRLEVGASDASPVLELIEGGKQAAADEVPPWEELPDKDEGAKVLDAVHHFLGRFVCYPSKHAQVAHTLWIAHAHALEAFNSTPRLAFLSPEPASGKTRALEVTSPLVPRPVEAVNVSPAYLFRKVGSDEGKPTILFDEIDTVFGPKVRNDNEDIRALLNAGHRKGAIAGRCATRGSNIVPEDIPAYSALALAGLGGLPDTIMTRSIIVKMRRRASDEKVEPWRIRIHTPQGEKIRDALSEWTEKAIGSAVDEFPEMPKGVEDRDADVWEALFIVAQRAGGEWPARCSAAAVYLIKEAKDDSASLGVQLLSDMRGVFGIAEKLKTEDVIEGLLRIPESQWEDVQGQTINATILARLLKPYDIHPKVLKICDKSCRGYEKAHFIDAWKRYLPPQPKA